MLFNQHLASPSCLPFHHSGVILFKELQYKYNKKFWNFQIFLLFFAIFCAYSWIRTNALPYPYGRFLCLSGLTDSISNISRHYFDSSVVSCSVYASNLYRQIGNAGRVSTYTFNLCGCVLSRCIFIQPRLLNYNAEISSIMNGCFPPLLCILLELVLAGTVSSRRIRLFKWQCTIPSSPLGISNNPCYSTGIHNMFMNLFCGPAWTRTRMTGLWVVHSNLWITGPNIFSKNFNNTKITKKFETSKYFLLFLCFFLFLTAITNFSSTHSGIFNNTKITKRFWISK